MNNDKMKYEVEFVKRKDKWVKLKIEFVKKGEKNDYKV